MTGTVVAVNESEARRAATTLEDEHGTCAAPVVHRQSSGSRVWRVTTGVLLRRPVRGASQRRSLPCYGRRSHDGTPRCLSLVRHLETPAPRLSRRRRVPVAA